MDELIELPSGENKLKEVIKNEKKYQKNCNVIYFSIRSDYVCGL